MVKTMRTLLIALAVASPVLAGLSWADQLATTVAFRAAAPSHAGSREDAAGTASEQVEEDDGEEEESRDLPVGCSLVAHPCSAGSGRFVTISAAPDPRAALGQVPRSRGPPTSR